MNKLKYLPILFTIAIAVSSAPFAQAISYDINEDHSSGHNLGTAPYGTVTLTQNGTTVDVTVALAAGYSFVKTGSVDFQAFKFNAVGITLGDITIDAHTPALQANGPGSFDGDGTGHFAFGISAPSQGSGGSDPFTAPILFHVAGATIADLTQPNNSGNLFVVDLLGNGNTGPAAAMPTDVINPLGTVPDGGATVMLLGTALGALGMARRYLKR